jgi:hypothetical protein
MIIFHNYSTRVYGNFPIGHALRKVLKMPAFRLHDCAALAFAAVFWAYGFRLRIAVQILCGINQRE